MQDIRKGAVLIWSFLLCAGAVYAAPTAAPLDLTLIQTIADPEGDARRDYAAVDPVTRRLYVARGDGVMAVDLNSGKVTHQVVAGKRVHAVVPLAGNRVLSTNGDSHSVTLFDGLSGQIIAETVTGQKPDGAFFEPFSGSVFVMDGKGRGRAAPSNLSLSATRFPLKIATRKLRLWYYQSLVAG